MSPETMEKKATEGAQACCFEESLLRPGNTNCGGCGLSIVLNMISAGLDAAGKKARMVIPACCGIVTAGGYPTSSYGSPVLGATFGGSPAFATGVSVTRDLCGEDDYVVINLAGDGGTYDIGMATLSAAAERNENLIYFCYDNEIYGNTGGQRSSATRPGAKTTTTPYGKKAAKKDIVGIMAAHGIPYAATMSIAHPEDFAQKMKQAIEMTGFRFLLAHSPCPTGWKSEPSQTVQLVRDAVNSGLFPLYEVYDGKYFRVNVTPDDTDPAIYYQGQRRFPKNGVDFDVVRAEVKHTTERLAKMAECWPADDRE